ncbi:hypothetical protein D1007_03225 [Hordeum vulgare]|nr:hypothetical protein D1007_03225 [Hordeum vulgare]
MAYEPAKMCHFNPRRKASRWISWSEMNPGRRYYACVDAMHGGCGFVESHDPSLPKIFSDLIGDLRNEVWKLKGDGRLALAEDAFGDVHMAEDEAGADMLPMNLQEQMKMELKKRVCPSLLLFLCLSQLLDFLLVEQLEKDLLQFLVLEQLEKDVLQFLVLEQLEVPAVVAVALFLGGLNCLVVAGD